MARFSLARAATQQVLAVTAVDAFSAQPHDSHAQTSQLHETPSQFGQWQSTQLQAARAFDEAFA